MMNNQPHALYIHIPFCKHICSYCAFNVHLQHADEQNAFVQALIQEIIILARQKPNLPLITVSLGGGTPSLLTQTQLTNIINAIHTHFDVPDGIEISLEANPNDITTEHAQLWSELGFNRISIGMQSSHSHMLKLFERQHDNDMVDHAVSILKKASLKNINLDLIFGIPHQTLQQWHQTLQYAIALQPTHLSLYGLELHGNTKLTNAIQAGQLEKPDDDLSADMYELAQSELKQTPFEQYEISNWALPNHQSQHNLHYWHNLPYLGLGAGAHGYANNHRTINRRLPSRYTQALRNPNTQAHLVFPRTPATSKFTPVTPQDEIAETIMMNLRLTRQGINRDKFYQRFGTDITEIKKAPLAHLSRKGLIEITPRHVRLTPKAYLLSNYVLRELL